MTTFKFKACTKCQGTLATLDDELYCLNCGQIVYPDSPDYSLYLYHEGGRKRRETPAHTEQASADVRWMLANARLIDMIRADIGTADISMKTGVEPRQIRAVRESLSEVTPG